MKSTFRKGFGLVGVVAAFMLVGAWSTSYAQAEPCDTGAVTTVPQDTNATASIPISETQCITPYIVPPADGNDRGGNRSCADVGKAYFGNPLYYLCRSDKKDFTGDFDLEGDGSYSAVFGPAAGLPDECDNTIDVSTDGYFVDWESTDPVGAAIIKGGPGANTYVYEPQVTEDTGLASPTNPGGNPPALSNIGGFCWNPEETPPDECFADETAWAANGTAPGSLKYNPGRGGNWATYVQYSEKTVNIYAGQTMLVGTAAFSAVADEKVTITINLTGDWVFGVNYELDGDGNPILDGDGNPIRDHNIKIQDYASAPSGNPSPGLFDHKFVGNGQSAVVEVPANNYYGVHLDVAVPFECPSAE